MKPAVDGIAVSTDDERLVYGAMSQDILFRVPTAVLLDDALDGAAFAADAEPLGRKPLSDGLSADLEGGIWITDVEHGTVVRRAPGGALETWIKTRGSDERTFSPSAPMVGSTWPTQRSPSR